MFWYIGACILTGNTQQQLLTHTVMLIHRLRLLPRWLSLCDSYDSWLSSSEVDGKVEELPHTEKPWRVNHPLTQKIYVGRFSVLYVRKN